MKKGIVDRSIFIPVYMTHPMMLLRNEADASTRNEGARTFRPMSIPRKEARKPGSSDLLKSSRETVKGVLVRAGVPEVMG